MNWTYRGYRLKPGIEIKWVEDPISMLGMLFANKPLEEDYHSEIDLWQLMQITNRGEITYHIIGWLSFQGGEWITSRISAYSPAWHGVQTGRNEDHLYKLLDPAVGDLHPRLMRLMRIACGEWELHEEIP